MIREAFWQFKEYIALALAGLLGLFGLVVLLGASMGGPPAAGTLALGVGLGLLPILVGLWLGRSVLVGRRRRHQELAERQVLELAARVGGRLTPVQVAQATRLTIDESKVFLDRLDLEGHCRLELAADGVMSYRFVSSLPALPDGR